MRGDFSRIRLNRRQGLYGRPGAAGARRPGRRRERAVLHRRVPARGQRLSTSIGEFGGPAGDAGFEITVVRRDEILIGPGRYYVDGLLCENPAGLSYDRQPFLLDPAPSGSDVARLRWPAQRGGSFSRSISQVWQRLVTALDDPCLRESALGQADTTARLQTVWRVVAS